MTTYTLTARCTDTGRVDTVEGLTAKEVDAEMAIWKGMGRSVTVKVTEAAKQTPTYWSETLGQRVTIPE